MSTQAMNPIDLPEIGVRDCDACGGWGSGDDANPCPACGRGAS